MAKDIGASTVGGVAVEGWSWSDNLIIIPMDHKTIFLDTSSDFKPVALNENITPFGKASIGVANQTFSKFSGAKLDASVFAVTGIENCPQGSGCQQVAYATSGKWSAGSIAAQYLDANQF